MRIICDQCNHQISGAVKRFSGNFNLHPECFTEFTNNVKTSNTSTLTRRESYLPAVIKVEATNRYNVQLA